MVFSPADTKRKDLNEDKAAKFFSYEKEHLESKKQYIHYKNPGTYSSNLHCFLLDYL